LIREQFPNSRLLKDNSQRELKPMKHMTCKQIREALRELGLNGAMEIVPVQQWHPMGQVIGSWRQEENIDLEDMITVTAVASMYSMKVSLSVLAQGIYHGSVWHTVATSDPVMPLEQAGWSDLLQIVDRNPLMGTPHVYSLMHGIGHGLLLKHTEFGRKNYTDCQSSVAPATIPHDEFLTAITACMKAFSLAAAGDCVIGASHGFFEHDMSMSALPPHAREWYQPCDGMPGEVSHQCYLILLNWMGHDNQIWRAKQLQALPRWWEACSSLEDDLQERGCIWGLTGNLFPFFEGAVTAPDPVQLVKGRPSKKDCLSAVGEQERDEENSKLLQETDDVTLPVDDPSVYCDVIFASNPPTKMTGTGLIDFCSRFGAPWEDRRDQLKFLSCVSGSMQVKGAVLSFLDVITMDDVGSFCDQLVEVPWTSSAGLRHEARGYCMAALRELQHLRGTEESWAHFQYSYTGLMAQTNYEY